MHQHAIRTDRLQVLPLKGGAGHDVELTFPACQIAHGRLDPLRHDVASEKLCFWAVSVGISPLGSCGRGRSRTDDSRSMSCA